MAEIIVSLRRRLGLWRRWRRDFGSLSRAKAMRTTAASVNGLGRVLLVPCDPWTLIGSRGDEAMLCAAVDHYKALNPDLEVHVLTATSQASLAAKARGWVPHQIWVGRFDFGELMKSISSLAPSVVVLLGADVMDGYYSPGVALRILGIADLCARQGIPTTLLGFSFNKNPYKKLAGVFDDASESLCFNVRDEISLGRFLNFTRHSAQLVADAAFHLSPFRSGKVSDLSEWLEGQRKSGNKVLGFNAHPMLFKKATPELLKNLVETCIASLSSSVSPSDYSLLMIPHDFRGEGGDGICLRPIYDALLPVFGDRIKLIDDELTAPELKAVAGELDALVTGRMHLAIAALGMGVPVAALTYQDKFQGLFRHFGLPDSLLLAPEQLQGPDALAHMLRGFLADQAKLKQQVGAALPGVKALSARNFVEPKQA